MIRFAMLFGLILSVVLPVSTAQAQRKYSRSYKYLKKMEWCVGSWSGKLELQGNVPEIIKKQGQAHLDLTIRWSNKKSALTAQRTLRVQDRIITTDVGIIGWDPDKKVIRYQLFDSRGGFGSGVWKDKDKKWILKLKLNAGSGSKFEEQYVVTGIQKDYFVIEHTNPFFPGFEFTVRGKMNRVKE